MVRAAGERDPSTDEVWLRFVAGRPVSAITTSFLDWCCAKLATVSKTALLLVWDNASWHRSHEVRGWIRTHNRQVKTSQEGVRILSCFLPSKSPWLNPIEPKWRHTKRKVLEANGLLTGQELTKRIEAVFAQPHEEPLAIPGKVA